MTDLSKRLRARAAKLRRFGYSYGELSVNDLDEIANALEVAPDAPPRISEVQIRHLRTVLGLLNGMGYPDEAETIVALLATQTNEEPQ